MEPSTNDPWLVGAVVAVGLASLATWALLSVARLRSYVLLPYEARRSVPWGIWATLLAVAFTLIGILGALAEGGTNHAGEHADMPNRGLAMWAPAVVEIAFVVTFVWIIATVSQATRQDVGLPGTFLQGCRDVMIGILACLAAYVPVVGVRVMTVLLFGQPADHPMVEVVKDDPSSSVFATALLFAVVVAPICEELAFRLLLQGWLEKWEDEELGRQALPLTGDVSDGVDNLPAGMESPIDSAPTAASELAAMKAGDTYDASCAAAAVPSEGVFGMPRGMMPILVSSGMFASAHAGNSTDAFPLFALAMFLGFIYQRTHRILPSIAAHATFNLISMLLLWRMIVSQAVE